MPSAIWINAKERKIEIVEAATLEDMQARVEGHIERILDLGNRHELYANETGRFRKFPYGFRVKSKNPRHKGIDIIGNGLIVAINDQGDNIAVRPDALQIAEGMVEWLDLKGVAIVTPPARVIILD